MAVGRMNVDQTSSVSLTVIVLEETAVTREYGPMTSPPIKSPTMTKELGLAEHVITPVVELYAVALMPIDEGMAPTH